MFQQFHHHRERDESESSGVRTRRVERGDCSRTVVVLDYETFSRVVVVVILAIGLGLLL
jgi:hypothetical protein